MQSGGFCSLMVTRIGWFLQKLVSTIRYFRGFLQSKIFCCQVVSFVKCFLQLDSFLRQAVALNKLNFRLVVKFSQVYLFVCLIGFYVTSTKYRSYGDVRALLVEEDLRRPSVHYFRHELAPE
jgi:hypothetical protein